MALANSAWLATAAITVVNVAPDSFQHRYSDGLCRPRRQVPTPPQIQIHFTVGDVDSDVDSLYVNVSSDNPFLTPTLDGSDRKL